MMMTVMVMMMVVTVDVRMVVAIACSDGGKMGERYSSGRMGNTLKSTWVVLVMVMMEVW